MALRASCCNKETTGHLEEDFVFNCRKQPGFKPKGLGLLWPWSDLEFGPGKDKITWSSCRMCMQGKAELAQRPTNHLCKGARGAVAPATNLTHSRKQGWPGSHTLSDHHLTTDEVEA